MVFTIEISFCELFYKQCEFELIEIVLVENKLFWLVKNDVNKQFSRSFE
jgi:hypothetical protein